MAPHIQRPTPAARNTPTTHDSRRVSVGVGGGAAAQPLRGSVPPDLEQPRPIPPTSDYPFRSTRYRAPPYPGEGNHIPQDPMLPGVGPFIIPSDRPNGGLPPKLEPAPLPPV